jgi:hypothetical protein
VSKKLSGFDEGRSFFWVGGETFGEPPDSRDPWKIWGCLCQQARKTSATIQCFRLNKKAKNTRIANPKNSRGSHAGELVPNNMYFDLRSHRRNNERYIYSLLGIIDHTA